MNQENWVKSLGLDTDGTLFVELESGVVLFDASCHASLSETIRILPEVLMEPENRRLYFCFLSTLNEISEIIYKSSYDGFYKYKKGDVVVDAGARIGTFAAKASPVVGEKGKVVAIEPEPRNFARLVKNIEANRFENVIAVQKMLWSQPQASTLYLSAYGAAHSAFCHEFYNSTGESIPVEADTLDNILRDLGIPAVNFIKMDIEGSEGEALKGMKKTLAGGVQVAIAAYHPVEGKPSSTVIVPQLESLGFKVRVLEGGIVQAANVLGDLRGFSGS
jgi:FkbM family methyltransferase